MSSPNSNYSFNPNLHPSFPVIPPRFNMSVTGLPPAPHLTRPELPSLPRKAPDPIQLAASFRCTDNTTTHRHVTRLEAVKDGSTRSPPITQTGCGVVNKDGLLRGKEVFLSGSNSTSCGRNFHQSATLGVGKEIAPGVKAKVYASIASGEKQVGGGLGFEVTPK